MFIKDMKLFAQKIAWTDTFFFARYDSYRGLLRRVDYK